MSPVLCDLERDLNASRLGCSSTVVGQLTFRFGAGNKGVKVSSFA